MDDLVAFLRARLVEEQLWAERFGDREWDAAMLAELYRPTASNLDPVIIHASSYDPARVLREVEAKRAILGEIESELADDPTAEMTRWRLSILAAVYRDHPDYDPAWKG